MASCHVSSFSLAAVALLQMQPLVLRWHRSQRGGQSTDSSCNTFNGTFLVPQFRFFPLYRSRLRLGCCCLAVWGVSALRLLVLLFEFAVTLHPFLDVGKTELTVNLRAREYTLTPDELHTINLIISSAVLEFCHYPLLVKGFTKWLWAVPVSMPHICRTWLCHVGAIVPCSHAPCHLPYIDHISRLVPCKPSHCDSGRSCRKWSCRCYPLG